MTCLDWIYCKLFHSTTVKPEILMNPHYKSFDEINFDELLNIFMEKVRSYLLKLGEFTGFIKFVKISTRQSFRFYGISFHIPVHIPFHCLYRDTVQYPVQVSMQMYMNVPLSLITNPIPTCVPHYPTPAANISGSLPVLIAMYLPT